MLIYIQDADGHFTLAIAGKKTGKPLVSLVSPKTSKRQDYV